MGQVDKVTVITVVYNDANNIRKTLLSCLDQDYPDVEYIIIDGGSTDGTKEIICEYKGSLDYFCSEKDNGIYDALNKGILKANGEWIIVLNSGDTFVSTNVLSSIFNNLSILNLLCHSFYYQICILDTYSTFCCIFNTDLSATS